MEKNINTKIVAFGANGASGIEITLFRSKTKLTRDEAEELYSVLRCSLSVLREERYKKQEEEEHENERRT